MRSALVIVNRALFLACSWTWCIGMFLPVFLVGDFGVWGWIAFAIPNVLGAAAVGLIVQTPERSKLICAHHPTAMRMFSAVTIAFHLYFLGQVPRIIELPFPQAGAETAYALSAVALLLAYGGSSVLSKGGRRAWAILSVSVFAISILAGVLMGVASGWRAYEAPPSRGEFDLLNLLWVTPALAFGFLLCPHLDLTFHRTRQELRGRAGDLAFLIGLCVFFLILIGFTLAYVASWLDLAWLNYWIVAHFFAQSVFTMSAHLRELRAPHPNHTDETSARRSLTPRPVRFSRREGGRNAAALRMWIIIAGALTGLAWPADSFRMGYDLILYAYAIPFPAYVWIVMIPRSSTSDRAPAAWLSSVLIATPIYAVGHLGGVWWLIPIAVLCPLLAPIVERCFGSRIDK